jgi:hypothetical protein
MTLLFEKRGGEKIEKKRKKVVYMWPEGFVVNMRFIS